MIASFDMGHLKGPALEVIARCHWNSEDPKAQIKQHTERKKEMHLVQSPSRGIISSLKRSGLNQDLPDRLDIKESDSKKQKRRRK